MAIKPLAITGNKIPSSFTDSTIGLSPFSSMQAASQSVVQQNQRVNQLEQQRALTEAQQLLREATAVGGVPSTTGLRDIAGQAGLFNHAVDLNRLVQQAERQQDKDVLDKIEAVKRIGQDFPEFAAQTAAQLGLTDMDPALGNPETYIKEKVFNTSEGLVGVSNLDNSTRVIRGRGERPQGLGALKPITLEDGSKALWSPKTGEIVKPPVGTSLDSSGDDLDALPGSFGSASRESRPSRSINQSIQDAARGGQRTGKQVASGVTKKQFKKLGITEDQIKNAKGE